MAHNRLRRQLESEIGADHGERLDGVPGVPARLVAVSLLERALEALGGAVIPGTPTPTTATTPINPVEAILPADIIDPDPTVPIEAPAKTPVEALFGDETDTESDHKSGCSFDGAMNGCNCKGYGAH